MGEGGLLRGAGGVGESKSAVATIQLQPAVRPPWLHVCNWCWMLVEIIIFKAVQSLLRVCECPFFYA